MKKNMLLFKILFLVSYVFKTESSALVVNSSSYSKICGTNPGLETVMLKKDLRDSP